MKLSVEPSRHNWQPLTPRGAASFARAPLRRLLAVQFVFALLAAAALVWFLAAGWCPTIGAAIQRLPQRGQISAGRLSWPASSPELLAEGSFLALVVDTNHSGRILSPAHVQVEFGATSIRVRSLFGYAEQPYPDANGWIVAFNRPELQPWWGAWEPPLLWAGVGLAVTALMAVWWTMAAVYAGIVRLAGFFANRELSFGQSWKLAGAALMPGALVMTAAIVFYGLQVLDLLQFIVAVALHLAVGVAYLFLSLWFTPRQPFPARAGQNPFAAPAEQKPPKAG